MCSPDLVNVNGASWMHWAGVPPPHRKAPLLLAACTLHTGVGWSRSDRVVPSKSSEIVLRKT